MYYVFHSSLFMFIDLYSIFAALTYAAVFGNVSMILHSVNSKSERHRNHMEAASEFIRLNNV